jgi:hypothetical protein
MSPRYTALMASLPPLGRLSDVGPPAISRLKLQKRLGLLHEDDRQTLDLITGILSPSIREDGPPGGPSDPQLLEEARRFFAEVRNPTLRRLVAHRLDMRTIEAALRRRRRGETDPPRGEAWGFGTWRATIERHWKEPAFRLETVFPWIPEAARLLEAGDLVSLERLLAREIWKELDRAAFGHNFDFEAVMIYLARWSLVDRRSHFDARPARERFRTLIRAGLGSHPLPQLDTVPAS